MGILGHRTAGSVGLRSRLAYNTTICANYHILQLSLVYVRLVRHRESSHPNAPEDPLRSSANKFNSSICTPVIIGASNSTPKLGESHIQHLDILKPKFPVKRVAQGRGFKPTRHPFPIGMLSNPAKESRSSSQPASGWCATEISKAFNTRVNYQRHCQTMGEDEERTKAYTCLGHLSCFCVSWHEFRR